MTLGVSGIGCDILCRNGGNALQCVVPSIFRLKSFINSPKWRNVKESSDVTRVGVLSEFIRSSGC